MEHRELMTSRFALPANLGSLPERALPAGTRLDDYEIESVLAQSSVAVVYRAYDRVLKLHVAIKEYLPSGLVLRSAETQVVLRESAYARIFELGRQAFINEARILAQCEHASLLRILRILQHHGTVYRVMRCCPGPTLREYCGTMAGTPGEIALRAWLDSLLGALAELHNLGWVHAAVSPGNILMLPGDRPVLLDSDAVRAALISDRTRSMMVALEPCFAPIEQREPALGRPIGPWTDLYSLAATLHSCISGHLPATPAAVAASQSFEPLGTLWPRLHADKPIPRTWLRALDACLAESAQDRPQSVAQLRSLLDGQRDGWSPVTECAYSPWVAVGVDARGGAGHELIAVDEMQANTLASLEQTLPFVAARVHESVAATRAQTLQAASMQAPRRRLRRLWIGGATVLMLMAAVTAGGWMYSQGSAALAGGSGLASGAKVSVPAAPDTQGAVPLDNPLASAVGRLDIVAGLGGVSDAASAAGPGIARDSEGTAARHGARVPASPREVCGSRSGYALYQCMQGQCARRNWTKHAQCQRLRQDQSLG